MLQFINKLFLKVHTRAVKELDSKASKVSEEHAHVLASCSALEEQLADLRQYAVDLTIKHKQTCAVADAHRNKVNQLIAIL